MYDSDSKLVTWGKKTPKNYRFQYLIQSQYTLYAHFAILVYLFSSAFVLIYSSPFSLVRRIQKLFSSGLYKMTNN